MIMQMVNTQFQTTINTHAYRNNLNVFCLFYLGTKHFENNGIWYKRALHFLQLTDLYK